MLIRFKVKKVIMLCNSCCETSNKQKKQTTIATTSNNSSMGRTVEKGERGGAGGVQLKK